MKTIYIVRHAKSSWDFIQLEDHERPLTEQGIKRTKLVGEYLAQKKVSVDLIISSHAVRAYETAKIIANALDYPEEDIVTDKQIYHADAGGFFYRFTEAPEEANSVMIVGHNPTVTELVNHFLKKPIDWLPTTGVAGFVFKAKRWEDLPDSKYKSKLFITPKMLKSQ